MLQFGRVFAFGLVIALVVIAGAVPDVAAQKKKDGAKDTKGSANVATPADYKTLQKAKDMTGTIVSTGGATVTIKLDYPHMEANPKYKAPANSKAAGYNSPANQQYRQYQDLMRQQQAAMRARTPQELQRAMQRYYQDMARFQIQNQQQAAQMMARAAKNPNNANNTNDPFIVVHSYKEYELELQDKVVVRKMFLALEFDDAGAPKTYTEKEKAALRGDDKSKPGYSAKLEDATPGTEARLYLTPPAKKEKAPDAKDGDTEVERPTVRMIVLTKESPMQPSTGAPEKKKKK